MYVLPIKEHYEWDDSKEIRKGLEAFEALTS